MRLRLHFGVSAQRDLGVFSAHMKCIFYVNVNWYKSTRLAQFGLINILNEEQMFSPKQRNPTLLLKGRLPWANKCMHIHRHIFAAVLIFCRCQRLPKRVRAANCAVNAHEEIPCQDEARQEKKRKLQYGEENAN